VKHKYTDRLSLSTLGLAGAGVILAIVNWRLVLSLSCGIATMAIVYQYPRSDSPKKKLVWAVLSGSGSIFVCYLFIMLLQSDPNLWVGFAHGLEFLAVLITLGFVLYRNIGNNRSDESTDQLIIYLASEDRLTRLIALKQLHQKVLNHALSFVEEEQLREYCSIILQEEASSALRNVALETIETLQFMAVKPKFKPNNNANDISIVSTKTKGVA